MSPTVDPGTHPAVDDKPRLTPADAEARFAALVAEHRAGKKSRATATPAQADDKTGAFVLVLVFCLGVTAGAIFHVKPLLAIILGVPTIYIAHLLWQRSRTR